jgi:hypothetical protein
MSETVQAMVFSRDPDADMAFASDLFGIACAPAGGGWLLFTLPPGQSGLDPSGRDDAHQLYLSCDDLGPTVAALAARGADVEARDSGGRAVSIALPGGGRILLSERQASA